MKIETGTYVGDAVAGRLIPVTFKPEVVMLRGNATGFDVMEGRIRTASMPATLAKPMHELPIIANEITSFETTGFRVGSANGSNKSSTTFYWLALARNAINDLAVFAYEGNGADNRDIVLPNTPFQPDVIIIAGASSTRAVWKTTLMPAGDFCSDIVGGGSGTNYATNRIQSINPDGFEIGSNVVVNQNSQCFHVVALKLVPGLVGITHYTGNGIDDRSISIGLESTFMWTSSPKLMVNGSSSMRSRFHVGDSSICWNGTFANEANGIQSVLTSGFQVGTNDKVNQLGGAPGTFYDAIGFKDGAST